LVKPGNADRDVFTVIRVKRESSDFEFNRSKINVKAAGLAGQAGQ